MDYRSAGVDIEKGDRFARFIASIRSSAVSSSLGGFSGGIEIDIHQYKTPLLFSTTDGVGTKLLVAQRLQKFDTIGIDLVAMNVNDLAVCGVQPLTFLDYIACGQIKEEILQAVIQGIVQGCEQAGCKLVGGETAEMPDLYEDTDFDLAGFCVGLVEKESLLPKLDRMEEGDLIYALPSRGIHSNGLSLARKALQGESLSIWEELLIPTRIYVSELITFAQTQTILGAAHITGGGLEGNFVRVIPKTLRPQFTWNWKVPSIFSRIQEKGKIETSEMRRVFNMGIGIALVVSRKEEERFLEVSQSHGIDSFRIGELVRG
ncbi:MAG TPA: phosphoribosylformylglycinamidine cyclo-ligase [Spirochaetales bacterium]|nr:phosphoribosylformylglycinamidine cyclo-ligase [Spirochaetales bacterium]